MSRKKPREPKVNDRINSRGEEIGDSTQLAIPVGMRKPPTLQDMIQKYVRNDELMRGLNSAGLETFEESEDFDVEDDYDPTSPWEREFDPHSGKEMYRHERQHLDSIREEVRQELKAEQAKLIRSKRSKKASPPRQKQNEGSNGDPDPAFIQDEPRE